MRPGRWKQFAGFLQLLAAMAVTVIVLVFCWVARVELHETERPYGR